MLPVLERSDVENARIAGMATDLSLVGNKYQWLLIIFYIPCAPPLPGYLELTGRHSVRVAHDCWKLFPPHRYAAVMIFLRASLQAATQSWAGIMVCRFFLGAVECVFGAGLSFFLSNPYPRHEIGLRIGIFVARSAAANVYGGVLAYGLSHISTEISPRRLLFILESGPTCLMAVMVWFFLRDAPRKAMSLKPEEHKVAVARAIRQISVRGWMSNTSSPPSTIIKVISRNAIDLFFFSGRAI